MADQETSSLVLEFILRQPIPNHLFNYLLLSLPLSPPLSPRLLKTLLLRRLAVHLSSSFSSQTLTSLELIEQLDRDHSLAEPPSVSLQLAYAAVAVDLTAGFLKGDRDLGDFFDAVNRVWSCRVGDLESSEARGLVSERLREERRLMEEAVVNGVARGMLRRRETGEEAAEAVRAFLKEAVAELGPTLLELAAPDGCGAHRNDVIMSVGGNDAPNEDRCSPGGFSPLALKVIQEKNLLKSREEKDHNMVEETLSDVLTAAAGVPTVGAGDDSNLERVEADQSLIDRGQMPSIDNNDKGAEVIHTRDISSDTGNYRVHDTVMQPSITDQIPTELEHGEENQNVLDGNSRVFSAGKGNTEGTSTAAARIEGKRTVDANTEGTNTLTRKKRDCHAMRKSGVMDRNPTARTYQPHDDSIESSPEKSPNSSEELHVSHPKRRKIPVTKIPWIREFAGRRKKKWWSADEEDTLRKAVEKYGAGNWALMKSSYPATFEYRTPVDLKDKWRNMIR